MTPSSDKILPAESIPLQLDSRTIEYGRYFTVKGALPQLLVYVEDDEDKPFWRALFQCVKDRYSSIEVHKLQDISANAKAELNAHGRLLTATGKDALMQVKNLGKNKVIAVDRDWDGCVEGSKYGERMQNDPYVITTTYYSIENHLLTDEAINNYFFRYTSICLPQSAAQVLKDFSNCIETVLPYLMVEEAVSLKQHSPHQYSISSLRSDLASLRNGKDYAQCKSSIESKNAERIHVLRKDISICQSRLLEMGYSVDNYWKLVQGHTLFDYIFDWLKKAVIYELKEQIQKASQNQKKTISSKTYKMSYKLRGMIYNSPFVSSADPSIIMIQAKITKLPL